MTKLKVTIKNLDGSEEEYLTDIVSAHESCVVFYVGNPFTNGFNKTVWLDKIKGYSVMVAEEKSR